MRVERKTIPFEPVCITFETDGELLLFRSLLNYWCGTIESIPHNAIELAKALNRKLVILSDDNTNP